MARVKEGGLPLAYVNQVGGQDELVFDGASFVLNADLTLAAQLPSFPRGDRNLAFPARPPDGVLPRELSPGWRRVTKPIMPACVLGLRDYVDKNRFPGVVLGLSGGIDSALCAAMAVDALGAERVRAVMLPYRFTSQASLDDAAAIAAALGIRYEIVPIAPAVKAWSKASPHSRRGCRATSPRKTCSRGRAACILMAISNKFGLMVVTTGNKSEMSAGYATLYGDMNGGFNPVKDLYKTEVYRLARLRNAWRPDGALGPAGTIIPENVLVRAPSAELRENQTDQDSLPPYEVLDAVLERLIEREETISTIVAAGFNRDMVQRIERLLYLAEYKRRQAAPGVKVTLKSFGRDRRYPIVNRFRDPGTALPQPQAAAARGAAASEAVDF